MLRAPGCLMQQQDFIAGFAIKRSPDDPKQTHVALLYRDTDGTDWLLHLGWHCFLCHEPWTTDYHWIPFQHLDSELLDGLVDLAMIVAGRPANKMIPYSAVFEPRQYFDHSGDYTRHADGDGLTCATFLLALFRRWGLPLINESSWPKGRAGDAGWVLRIVRKLYKWCQRHQIDIALPHLFVQLRQRWALRRYRPEEVCASAEIFHGIPLSFQKISPVATLVLQELP